MTTLAGLISGLRRAGLDVDAQAIADILLLAAHDAGGVAGADGAVPGRSGDAAGQHREDDRHPAGDADGAGGAQGTTQIFDLAEGTGPGSVPARTVQVPRARSLPRGPELARALRPLQRRYQRGPRLVLDVDATIEAFADSRVLVPVMRPEPELWFELDLVVDDSPTSRVWEGLVAELLATFRETGAFRSVRRWRLDAAEGTLANPAGRPAHTARLRGSQARRLIVVLSDCVGPAWERGGTVWDLLVSWARSTPTALLNPLPHSVWTRTGIGDPHRWARLASRRPGGPNTSLVTHGIGTASRGLGGISPAAPGMVPMPVLGLTPHFLEAWASMIAARAQGGLTGVLLPPPSPGPDGPGRLKADAHSITASDTANTADGWDDGWDEVAPSAADYVAAFRMNASSPHVFRLAVLGAAAPAVSLSVLELLRQEVVTGAEVADLAEFVISDLVEPITGGRGETILRYRNEETRLLLRQCLAMSDAFAVHRAVSAFVARRAGAQAVFPAAVRDDGGDTDLPETAAAFAEASRSTLIRLGLTSPATPGIPPATSSTRPTPAALIAPASPAALIALPSPASSVRSSPAVDAAAGAATRTPAVEDAGTRRGTTGAAAEEPLTISAPAAAEVAHPNPDGEASAAETSPRTSAPGARLVAGIDATQVAAMGGQQHRAVRDAILAAFPTHARLDDLLDRLGRRLDYYAVRSEPLRDVVAKVVEGARAEGWLTQLLTEAVTANPGNRQLAETVDLLRRHSTVHASPDVGPVSAAGAAAGGSGGPVSRRQGSAPSNPEVIAMLAVQFPNRSDARGLLTEAGLASRHQPSWNFSDAEPFWWEAHYLLTRGANIDGWVNLLHAARRARPGNPVFAAAAAAFGGTDTSRRPDVPRTAGGGDDREGWDFFVSYAQKDRQWAEWIAWTLEEAGYRVLVQGWDTRPGTYWAAAMRTGIERATRTVVVLSAAYLRSGYTEAEWQAAWRADPDGQLRKLLVCRIEECERVGLFGQVVSLDLFDAGEEAAASRLLRAAMLATSGSQPRQTSAPTPSQGDALSGGRFTHIEPPRLPQGDAAVPFPPTSGGRGSGPGVR